MVASEEKKKGKKGDERKTWGEVDEEEEEEEEEEAWGPRKSPGCCVIFALQLSISIIDSFKKTTLDLHFDVEADDLKERIIIDIKVAGILIGRVFFLHLILIGVFVIFLAIHGLVSASRSRQFRADHWYPPIIASTALAGVVGFAWQWITASSPAKALKSAFWLAPLLSLASAIVFLIIGSRSGFAVGVVLVVISLLLSLYSCWVSPRFYFAIQILSVSTAFPPNKTFAIAVHSILISIFYSSFIASGIGGAIAQRASLGVKALCIVIILFSFAWTMQVIKNVIQVTISRVKYLNLARGLDMDGRLALFDTIKYLIGTISVGSAVAPVFVVIRGSARAMSLVAGDSDEFMFSCAKCYSGVASSLITRGNRWGYVRVGVYNKGFVEASEETWASFERSGLISLIDADLTGSFCFYAGVATGALGSLAAGTWALLLHTTYGTEEALFAFLIAYFVCRVAMAWPQACISSYYVAYAEDPGNARFDSTVPARIQELQRGQP